MTQIKSLSLSVQRIASYIVLVFILLICVVPIWLMLVNSTRSTVEIQQSISMLPSTHLLANWGVLTGRGLNVSVAFLNSIIVAVGTTVLSVYFSVMTAFGLAFYAFKGRKALFNLILILITIPPTLGLVGFYRYMLNLGLVDNFLPLIIPAMAAPSTVFFMRQYIRGVIHKDLIDAARIDGCNELRIFNQIAIPVLAPGMATMAIFTFVGSWNNFITPFILISDKNMYTLPMMVQMLRTDIYKTEFGGIYLGIAVTLLPILIFYLSMSRFIIAGVTVGSVKE
jgi:multiple sugar transport system permease protein